MKEIAAEELVMLAHTKRIRRRWDVKKSRRMFAAWAFYVERSGEKKREVAEVLIKKNNATKRRVLD